jgi:hypothetical protein
MRDADLAALMRGGPLDREIVERLKSIDRAELREVMGKYMTDDELDALERRIDALIAANP